MQSPEPRSGSGLVVLAPGGLADPAVAARLAALLGLRLLGTTTGDPVRELAALADQPSGWLLPLAVDPGAELSSGGCWAEALGAWRQPALLLIPTQAPAGAPRAYAALLQAAAVPLLGLVQHGGTWNPEIRLRDGLPWLGWLPVTAAGQPGSGFNEADDDAAANLLAASRCRWRVVSAARPVAPPLHPPGAGARPV